MKRWVNFVAIMLLAACAPREPTTALPITESSTTAETFAYFETLPLSEQLRVIEGVSDLHLCQAIPDPVVGPRGQIAIAEMLRRRNVTDCANVRIGAGGSVGSAATGLLDDGFRPGEELVSIESYPGDEALRKRTGTDPETGLRYTYYANGEGLIIGEGYGIMGYIRKAGWFMNCSVDDMSDRQTCAISSTVISSVDLSGGLRLRVTPSGAATRVCVYGNDFPGYRAKIRIDKNRPITTGESGCVGANASRQIVRQLRKGKMVLTDHYEWPKGYAERSKFNIERSFALAEELFRFTRSKLGSVDFSTASITRVKPL